MKATYISERDGGSIITLDYSAKGDKDQAEAIGQWLVDNHDFEWVTEEEGEYMQVGIVDWAIADLKDVYKMAKEALK